MSLRLFPFAAAMLLAGQAASAETGRAEYVFSSDLAGQGYEPFAASGSANASFGMKRDAEMYLCFIADDLVSSAERQKVLVAEINGKSPDRVVPNIPVVCVLTQ